MNLEQKIEAILFYKNEPVEIKKLCSILNLKEQEIREALKKLEKNLESRGVTLVLTKDEVVLATAKEASELIEKIAKDEMTREIGKAGLETLAIVVYNNGVERKEIDYVRGVNSSFILRNLSMRGLVERRPNPKDGRTFIYYPSSLLLAHLGLNKVGSLPDFEEMQKKILEIKNTAKEQDA